MTTAPVLGFADFTKPFILETDASHDGLSVILSQDQDGERRVLAYASRRKSTAASHREEPGQLLHHEAGIPGP